MRVKLRLAYDGARYHGSQIQTNAPTIQGELESALRVIRASDGRSTFAGRTDTGVHAAGQVVSCDIDWDRELERFTHGLNSVLPPDIRVLQCQQVNSRFSARFDATGREYRYRLVQARAITPLAQRYIWAHHEVIDSSLANAAASHFIGTHRFGSFASAGWSQKKPAEGLERTIFNCEWREIIDPLLPIPGNVAIQELLVRGDGFLPQMVRNIVAAILEVASGKKPLEWLEFLLVSGDRRLLGPPAPPHGLMLWNVEYAGSRDVTSGNKG